MNFHKPLIGGVVDDETRVLLAPRRLVEARLWRNAILVRLPMNGGVGTAFDPDSRSRRPELPHAPGLVRIDSPYSP